MEIIDMNKNEKFKYDPEFDIFYIMINNHLWSIEVVPQKELKRIYEETYGEEATWCYGLTLYTRENIYISEEMTRDTQLKTLRHELTHCMIWENGLFNVPNFTEEMVCDMFASYSEEIEEIIKAFEERKPYKIIIDGKE